MDLYDQHLHSRHSFDSHTDPVENVSSAIAAGLAGLTFTEHFDTHPDDWESCIYDDEAYSDTIRRLRGRFGRGIFIGKGIEVCFQPDHMPFILDLLDRSRFDLVLLSVHYFGERTVHTRENWTGIDAATGTRLYLERVRDAARFCADLHEQRGRRVFDVLGHLDLVKRYTQRFFGSYDVSKCGNVIDDILRALIAADVVPEINTSSLRQGLAETMPGPPTLARYSKLGGKVVSLGSDAHRPEHIGAAFEQACTMIRTAGLVGSAAFKDRERSITDVR
jgi:histidinol-phosphatase (PHP family)